MVPMRLATNEGTTRTDLRKPRKPADPLRILAGKRWKSSHDPEILAGKPRKPADPLRILAGKRWKSSHDLQSLPGKPRSVVTYCTSSSGQASIGCHLLHFSFPASLARLDSEPKSLPGKPRSIGLRTKIPSRQAKPVVTYCTSPSRQAKPVVTYCSSACRQGNPDRSPNQIRPQECPPGSGHLGELRRQSGGDTLMREP